MNNFKCKLPKTSSRTLPLLGPGLALRFCFAGAILFCSLPPAFAANGETSNSQDMSNDPNGAKAFMKVWRADDEGRSNLLQKMPLIKSYLSLQIFYELDSQSKKYPKVTMPTGKTIASAQWSQNKQALESQLEQAVLTKLDGSDESNAFIETLSISGAKALINLYKNNYKQKHGAWLNDYTAIIERLALQESIQKEQKRLDSYLWVLILASVLFGGFLGFILWEQRKLRDQDI